MIGTARNQQLQERTPLAKRWPFLTGIVVILGAELLLRNVLLPAHPSDVHLIAAMAAQWLLLIGLIGYWLPKVERMSLGSIGIGRFRWRHLWVGLAFYLLATIPTGFLGVALEAIGLESLRSLQAVLGEYSAFTLVGLFLSGTIVEEVFYRGYLIERISLLSNRRWLSGVVSWLAFTLVHLSFFGLGPTVGVSFLSAALVIVYLREHSLWPAMVLHGLNGLVAYLAFPLWLG
jgi:uncharacterized protein